MALMEEDRQIATQELDEIEAPRSRRGSLVGVVAGAARIVARRFSGAVALRPPEPAETAAETRPRKPLPLPNGYLASFFAVFVIPSFLCIVYLAFIASDQYVAEARFAVQTAQFGFASLKLDDDKSSGPAAAVGGLSSGAIPSVSSQDAYVITNYIGSRAIIDDLAGKIDIRAIFQRPEADFWARLKNDPSAEELTDYWKKMVSTYVEATSGIVTVKARAFRPADAKALATAIVEASERLANDVSARARTTIMQQAEEEVRRSEGLVRAALVEMRDFRDKQGFIDPLLAATSTSTLLLEAMTQKITLENNYFVASRAMSPDAPTVVELKSRLDGLDAQIEQLKAQLTGNSPEGRTVAASLVAFEELELKRVFAEKLYSMAQDALERARLRAEQQNIFVSAFVPPDAPQEAKYPERFSLSLLIAAGFFMIWAILAMGAAAIEDHRN
jgi:capsular polysaccharide transport system permease protein